MSGSRHNVRVVSGRADVLEAVEFLTELIDSNPGLEVTRALALVREQAHPRYWPLCGAAQQRSYGMALMFQPGTYFAGFVIVGRRDGELTGCAWAHGDNESAVHEGYEALAHEALLSTEGRHIFNEDLPDGFQPLSA